MIAAGSDPSSETAVDAAVREFTADVLELDPPPEVESMRLDDGGRVYSEELGEFCARVGTREDGNARSSDYTHDSSQRNVETNKVLEKRNETWEAPPTIGATSTVFGLFRPGRDDEG